MWVCLVVDPESEKVGEASFWLCNMRTSRKFNFVLVLLKQGKLDVTTHACEASHRSNEDSARTRVLYAISVPLHIAKPPIPLQPSPYPPLSTSTSSPKILSTPPYHYHQAYK